MLRGHPCASGLTAHGMGGYHLVGEEGARDRSGSARHCRFREGSRTREKCMLCFGREVTVAANTTASGCVEHFAIGRSGVRLVGMIATASGCMTGCVPIDCVKRAHGWFRGGETGRL